jgi:TonB family protein
VLEWSETLTRLAAQLKIARAIPILESALVGLPVVIGWLRPVILVPAGVFASLTPSQVEAILAHELAHIRRGDYVVNAVQRVVEIVLFYHPAVWWVSACIRREREHCCDDLAVPLSSSPLAYAHALVALEERRGRAPALAMAATGGGLFARVRRIVDPSWPVESAFPKGAVMTLVSSVLALVLTGAVSVGHAASTTSPDRPVAAPAVPIGAIEAARPDAAPVLVPRVAAAAQASGAILGAVTDPQNGVVPGATITVDTIGRAGASRTGVSDASGKFAVTDLPDGAYLLTVKVPGFKHDERRVDVASGAALTENIQLTLGSLQVSMTVVSGGPAQQTPTSAESVAGLLDAARKATDAGRLAEAEASLRAALAVLHAAQPQPPPPIAGAVRVGGDIKAPRKIRNVDPVYPRAARAAGIQGVVVMEATLDRDGSVANAVVIRGVPELNDAALDAVRQWAFTPTLLNGVPVPVLMTVTVGFAVR